MSENLSDKPYMDKPSEEKTTKEQMIYGAGETLKEIEKKKENLQPLNEGT